MFLSSKSEHSVPPSGLPKAARGSSLNSSPFLGQELQTCTNSLTQGPPVTVVSADGAKDYPWPGFLFKPYRDSCTGLSFVTNSSVVIPGIFWPNTAPKILFQIFLLFSWKYVQEGCCTNSACLKKTWKHSQLSYLVPWNWIIHPLLLEMQM